MLVGVLILAVLAEGYYIFALRDKMEKQEEELRTISQQLQSLKSERTNLHEELSTITKAGEKEHGNADQR